MTDKPYVFGDELLEWPKKRVLDLFDQVRPEDMERALGRVRRTPRDLAALLSPMARPRLEEMAVESRRLTRKYFGRIIGLYAPLYLSSICVANCPYCGFSNGTGGQNKRKVLSPQDIRQECEALYARGFRNLLLVAGEAPKVVTADYLAETVTIVREYFPSVSIEVQSMEYDEYRHLCRCGLEGVTLYMETYDRAVYDRIHRRGTKKDYLHRLDAIERAGRAGARRINIGALLGLADWRQEVFALALHARYLQKTCWQSSVAISFPRLKHVPDGFTIPAPVGDADFVQLMLALRLYLPEVGFALSTREGQDFRDRLLPLGVTLMSAGSSTRPGGYAGQEEQVQEQFEIEDRRSLKEVAEAIRRAGYDPVWKDFDLAYGGT